MHQDLKERFLELLDADHPEQTYQSFLEQNTSLIPREFVQNHGIHFDLAFRKLRLASDYAPDFFYMSKSSADWNLVLIELEKPSSLYFKPGTNDIHPDFTAGLEQINRWRSWFESSANYSGFVDGTLGQVRTPMGRNRCHLKYVLVHGRRQEFVDNDHRRAQIRIRETEDFKIVSFDSLIEALHTKHPLYICARKNEFLDILSTKFVSEEVFSYMDPSLIRITDELRKSIAEHRDSWRISSLKGGLELDHRLPRVGRR